jgi:acyl-CoA synthetase (NDP forming)
VHKSDLGLVILGINSVEDAKNAAATIADRAATAGVELEGIMLQRQIDGGVEMIVGVTNDPSFGPLVGCGLGGVTVELLRDVSFRLTPVSDLDATEMIDGLRSSPLFAGYRGAPAHDRKALEALVCRVSALVEAAPEIVELDLNPVKVLEDGEGAIAIDARIRVAITAR